MGTEIYWEDCNFDDNKTFIDHTCNTLDDLEGMNCKLFASEKGIFWFGLFINYVKQSWKFTDPCTVVPNHTPHGHPPHGKIATFGGMVSFSLFNIVVQTISFGHRPNQ